MLGLVAALTIAVPLGATASSGGSNSGKGNDDTFIAPGLLKGAEKNPGQKLHVIIQSSAGAADAKAKLSGLGANVRKQLDLIGAVAVDITAGKLDSLRKKGGLTITADAPVKLSGTVNYSTQLWPYASGVAYGWGYPLSPAPPAPTVAIVDSGIQANRADFDNGARVLPQVNLASLTPNAAGDGRGHGTFVAGIAAGSAPGFAGATPNARVLPIDVMDDSGKALTSDVIAACNYILQNKAALNIKVANFSLHSAAQNHFYNDPLDRAVEKLWFGGVFVVAAAGNYGSASGPSGVLNAPGNDPFVMTVGAVDLGSSFYRSDDTVAPWSAWGSTEDGFAKPEISAPGRYMVGPVPSSATLTSERPDHVVSAGYMQLSGTSFSAPVVAGAAAQLLARHPSWTPDQVKGALMVTAAALPGGSHAGGVGELNAARALGVTAPPVANSGLNAFKASDSLGGLTFNAASWIDVVKSNASWADASWGDASWGDASWTDASWGDASWSAASWGDASWGDASWADASWADTSSEDGVEGESGGTAAVMDGAAAAALQASSMALPAAQVAVDPVVP